MRILIAASLATAIAVQAVPRAQAPTPQSTEIEQLRKELEAAKRDAAEATEALGIARAARADCETTLGPVEAQVRHADIERRWTELKALMEQHRPGEDCDARSGQCVKKPAPPPDVKKDPPAP